MDVRDVHFDDRSREHLQRVDDRDRSERIRGRVDDDAARIVGRLVDPVDELRLAVGLPKDDGTCSGLVAALRLDFGERRRAVDRRLARAEPIQIGSVQDMQRLGGR